MTRLLSFFRTPKPRRFNFQARYYDAEKEAFEQRIRKAVSEVKGSTAEIEASKARIRDHFSSRRNKKFRNDTVRRNIRLMIIILLLGLLFYFVLK